MNIQSVGAWLDAQLYALGGDTGVYIKNLVTGEVWQRGEDVPVVAASVIKIPVMIEAFRQAQAFIQQHFRLRIALAHAGIAQGLAAVESRRFKYLYTPKFSFRKRIPVSVRKKASFAAAMAYVLCLLWLAFTR